VESKVLEIQEKKKQLIQQVSIPYYNGFPDLRIFSGLFRYQKDGNAAPAEGGTSARYSVSPNEHLPDADSHHFFGRPHRIIWDSQAK